MGALVIVGVVIALGVVAYFATRKAVVETPLEPVEEPPEVIPSPPPVLVPALGEPEPEPEQEPRVVLPPVAPPPTVIPGAKPTTFAYASSVRQVGHIRMAGLGDGHFIKYQVDVKNTGEHKGTCTIDAFYKLYSPRFDRWDTKAVLTSAPNQYGKKSVVLEPGETGTLEWYVSDYTLLTQVFSKVITWAESEAGKTDEYTQTVEYKR